MSEDNPVSVTDYHEQTKHRFTGLAKGPDTLDWDAQPVAFRRFEGAPLTPLPLTADQHSLPFSALFDGTDIAVQPVNLTSIGLLLEISMALAAWKQYDTSRWALRCNPSSGNLHPTEAYLIALGQHDLEDGLYHYRPDEHALEQRCRYTVSPKSPNSGLLLGLSSIHWREAWKYGERAYRYCQLDVGHALAALSYAAATLGWRVRPLLDVSDERLTQLLGIDRQHDYPKGSEQEHPDLLLSIHPADGGAPVLDDLIQSLESAQWHGQANILDRRHFYHWPIIDHVTHAASRPAQRGDAAPQVESLPAPQPLASMLAAASLYRKRRSAQAFDGVSSISQREFYRTLDHLLPRPGITPWDCQPWPARVHLVLFVHRVEGLEPGIYALPRRTEAKELLQAEMNPDFAWQRETSAPQHLPLYRLGSGKVEGTAIKLSCGQRIAGQSAFSLAMLAEFEGNLSTTPWRYRELHWEAGTIGQALYLEAEASELQGTGIGCFFDDGVHELLGIEGRKLQVLYHFTIGKAVVDERITQMPPYPKDR